MTNPAEYNLTPLEFARLVGVSASTIRRWEDEGIYTSQRQTDNTRRYSSSDIEAASNYKEVVAAKKAASSRSHIYAKADTFVGADSYPKGDPSRVVRPQEDSLQNKQEENSVFSEVNPGVHQDSPHYNRTPFRSFFSVLLPILTLGLIAASIAFLASGRMPENIDMGNILSQAPFGLSALNPYKSSDIQPPTSNFQPPTTRVLAATSPKDWKMTFTIPTFFKADIDANGHNLNLGTGKITASNVIYSLTAGTGINVTGGQNATITNTGVTSIGGSTGELAFENGLGIKIEGLKFTNTDKGSDQNIFKNIEVNGSTLTASSNNDTFKIIGTGDVDISLSNKDITINADPKWTLSGNFLYPANIANFVGIGTATPATTLDVTGTGHFTGAFGLDSTLGVTGATTLSSTLGVTREATMSGTLAVTGATILSSTLAVTGNTTLTGDLVKIRNVAYTWPSSQGGISSILQNDGSGNLAWIGSGSSGTIGYWTRTGTTLSPANSGDLLSFFGGINNNSGGITNVGTILGGTGFTSSGTITLSGIGSGVVRSDAGGVLSTGAVNLSGSEVTGTLPIARGGTNIVAYNPGDMLYANDSGALINLGVGAQDNIMIVNAQLKPSWGMVPEISGDICTNCLINNPASDQYITPTQQSATGLIIKQASGGNTEVFAVTNYAADFNYFSIGATGNATIGGTMTVAPANTDNITISPVAKGTTAYTGTITSNDLTAARVWTFPNYTGGVCLDTGNCAGVGGVIGGGGANHYVPRFNSQYNIESSIIYDDGLGHVGIATTAPTKALTVAGTFEATSSATFGSTVNVTGDTTMTGGLDVTGATVLRSTLNVTGATILSDTLNVTGGGIIGGTFSAGAAKFTVSGAGDLTKINNVAYTWPGSQGAANALLTNDSAGNLSWANPASTGIIGYWNRVGTALSPTTLTDNVGIGTTSPTNKLSVIGSVGIGTTANGYNNAAPTNGLIVEGNVGIGTTSPTSMLSVGSASQFQVNSTGNIVSINNVATSFPASQGAANSILTNDSAGNLTWANPASTGIIGYWNRVGTALSPTTLTDNVGIGVTDADTKLEILGTSTQLKLSYDGTYYTSLTVDSAGQLTIAPNGTTAARFSDVQNNFDLPTSFNAVGDVTLANDLLMANQSAANIRSLGPFTIETGESWESNNLVLKTYNQGSVLVDFANADTTAADYISLRTSPIISGAMTTGTRNIYGFYNDAQSVAANSGGTTNLYGNYVIPSSTLSTAGTTNVYGSYIGGTATHAADAGTVNQYGLYIANGTSSTNGTSTKTGLYVESPTGADTNYAAIFAGGNVGIGTTSPTGKLEIAAASGMSLGTTVKFDTAANLGTTNLKLWSSGTNLYVDADSFNYRNAAGGLQTTISSVGNISTTGTLTVSGTGNSSIAGNVGIGTTSPTNKLSVIGAVGIGTTANGYNNAAPANGMIIEGNVGIGTTAPGAKLDVNGNINVSGAARNIYFIDGSTSRAWLGIGSAGGYFTDGLTNALNFRSEGAIQLGSGAVSDMTIATSGNVGIGTTAPGELLQVLKSQDAATRINISNVNTGTSADASLKLSSDGGDSYLYRTSAAYSVTAIQDDTVIQDGGGGDIVLWGAAEIARFTNSGNVGIGTTAPGAKLDVNGNINVSGAARNIYFIDGSTSRAWLGIGSAGGYFTDGLTNALNFRSEGAIQLGSGAVSDMTIATSGNVGIGTTAPAGKLDLSSGGTQNVLVVSPNIVEGFASGFLQAAGVNTSPFFNLGGSATTSTIFGGGVNGDTTRRFRILTTGEMLWGPGNATHDVNLYRNAADVLRTSDSLIIDGNVGIGTTNPGYKLDVYGDAHIRTAAVSNSAVLNVENNINGDNSSANINLTSWTETAFLRLNSDSGIQTIGTSGDLILANSTSGRGRVLFGTNSTPTLGLSYAGGLSLGSTYYTTDAGAGNMIIQGNVGIGTTSPTNKLSVIGAVGIGTTQNGYNNAAPTNGMIIEGNVGIGTTSPAYKLDVSGSMAASSYSIGTTGQGFPNSYTMQLGTDGGIGTVKIAGNASGILKLQGGGSEGIAINGVGSVGIGTTAPAAKLEVLGTTTQMQLSYDSSNYAKWTVASDGTLTLNNSGTDTVAYNQTGINFNVPTSFNASGDVSLAYDLIFTNPTLATIKNADGPLTIESGNSYSNLDLTLRTFGTGALVLDTPGGLASMQAQAWTLADSVAALNMQSIAGQSLFNVDTTNGRIGIGTTSPLSRLTVQGSTADSTKAAMEVYNSAATSLLYVRNDGNVGIGTTAPTSSLSIVGNEIITNAGITPLQMGPATNLATDSSYFLINNRSRFGYNGTLGAVAIDDNAASKPLVFLNGASAIEKMRITTAGYVGIGTTSPGNMLSVIGAVGIGTTGAGYNAAAPANGMIIEGSVGIGTVNPGSAKLYVVGSAIVGDSTAGVQSLKVIGTNSGTSLTTASNYASSLMLSNVDGTANSYADMRFVDAGANSVAGIAGIFINDANNQGALAFWTRNNATLGEKMRIDMDGNVGIGTTAPTELLHIVSSAVAEPILRIENTNADNNPGALYFIKNSVSPAASDILGQFSFYGDDAAGTENRFGTIFTRSADVTDGSEDGSLHFKHLVAGTDTEVMTLTGGNVGIGTTSPTNKLSVIGAVGIGTTGAGYNNAAPANGMIVQGNVGIGTTGPAWRFQVGETANYGWVAADGTWASSSDINYKTNVSDLNNLSNLDKVLGLNPIRYDTLGETLSLAGEGRHLGFSAQAVEALFPELVSTDSNGYKGLNYAGLVVPLVGAVKEQQSRLTVLGAQVASLQQSTASAVATTTVISPTDFSDLKARVDLIASSVDFLKLQASTSAAQATTSAVGAIHESPVQLDASGDLKLPGNVAIYKNLNVLGKTTLSDLSVTGTIQTGLLNINGFDAQGGASLNVLAGALRLQPLSLGNVDFFNGQLVVKADGSLTTKGELNAKTVVAEEFKVKGTSIAGSARTAPTIGTDPNVGAQRAVPASTAGKSTLPAGLTTLVIPTSAVDANSMVFVTPETTIKGSLAVTKKTAGQSFTVEISSPEGKPVPFSWFIVGVEP